MIFHKPRFSWGFSSFIVVRLWSRVLSSILVHLPLELHLFYTQQTPEELKLSIQSETFFSVESLQRFFAKSVNGNVFVVKKGAIWNSP